MKQISLLKKENQAYGGDLLKTRKERSRPRPLDTRNSMHLVLRSSKAIGQKSFRTAKNQAKIKSIVAKFAAKNGIKILSLANVGNHLHFHIRLSNRYCYKPFIRAITSAIAMAVSGINRWNRKTGATSASCARLKFWDYRPFTRVVFGLRAFLALKDYVQVNQLEGSGFGRISAKLILSRDELNPRAMEMG